MALVEEGALIDQGALSDQGETSAAGSIWDELADEEASAAVEFIVLIPIYLLLMTALFVVGGWAMARQQVVASARFHAWYVGPKTITKTSLEDAMFGPLDGSLKVTKPSPSDVFIGSNDFKLTAAEKGRLQSTSGMGTAERNAQGIANQVFNNRGEAPFVHSRVLTEFTSGGVTFGGLRVRQATESHVLLPKAHTRKEYESGKKHPATEWGGSQFGLSDPKWQPLSPIYDEAKFTGKGVWDRKARIDGSVNGEHSYYKPRVP